MKLSAMLTVLQDFENGLSIEYAKKNIGKLNWEPTETPSWNFKEFNYRSIEKSREVRICNNIICGNEEDGTVCDSPCEHSYLAREVLET